MSHIKSKDTSIEVKVRKWLFKCGFRYRKNVSNLPGKPDIVLAKYKTVVFINGCFFHHHENCRLAYIPKTNTEYWMDKFNRNMKNDYKNRRLLEEMGYRTITVWECSIRDNFEKRMEELKIEILDTEKGMQI